MADVEGKVSLTCERDSSKTFEKRRRESSPRLMLDFPRVRRAMEVRSPAVPAAASKAIDREGWEQARELLQESMAKAWRRLEMSQGPVVRNGRGEAAKRSPAFLDAELRLNSALAAARQLLARPDTRAEDLLEYLADLEAADQLLSSPDSLSSGAASSHSYQRHGGSSGSNPSSSGQVSARSLSGGARFPEADFRRGIPWDFPQ
ncbi:unnamed protein product, partial [Polarella glacialis]